jgi:hypothetical protein
MPSSYGVIADFPHALPLPITITASIRLHRFSARARAALQHIIIIIYYYYCQLIINNNN